MPLQNRVTPYSTIEAVSARGLFTGNRGILHNDRQQLVTTRWRHKAWIVCELEYKNMRRPLMEPNRWTQLFFLDEATAFAAGHRPCGYCRRPRYQEFLQLSGQPSAKALDEILHAQRTQPQPLTELGALPIHSLFAIHGRPYLKLKASHLEWTHHGYRPSPPLHKNDKVQPLTPPLMRAILAQGYQPILHPSAAID